MLFSEFGSQSNTKSEFTKSTVFWIDTNQGHPRDPDLLLSKLACTTFQRHAFMNNFGT